MCTIIVTDKLWQKSPLIKKSGVSPPVSETEKSGVSPPISETEKSGVSPPVSETEKRLGDVNRPFFSIRNLCMKGGKL